MVIFHCFLYVHQRVTNHDLLVKASKLEASGFFVIPGSPIPNDKQIFQVSNIYDSEIQDEIHMVLVTSYLVRDWGCVWWCLVKIVKIILLGIFWGVIRLSDRYPADKNQSSYFTTRWIWALIVGMCMCWLVATTHISEFVRSNIPQRIWVENDGYRP